MIPFSTTISISLEEEYVCNSCSTEKAGPFTEMLYTVEKDLDVVFCTFCQQELTNPLED
jgi:hypothetical protein